MAGKSKQQYVLMHKNVPVSDLELDVASGFIFEVGKAYSESHVPVGIPVKKGKIDRAALNKWWINRTIPESRSGIQNVLDILGLHAIQQMPVKSMGLSLSDQYWIRPAGSATQWSDVNFFQHPFSEDIGNVLFGKDSSKKVDFMSPDSTSDGWLKKKWQIIDQERCLIKGGSGATQQEPYNEVLASRIMDRLKIPHVSYRLLIQDDYPYCVCEDFVTPQTELVSAWYIMQIKQKPNHVSLYRHYLNCCEALGIPGIVEALNQMIVLDYLIANEDRHLNNFGAIRNAETLEWAGATPIYDNGSSLWFSSPTALIGSSARLICKPFKSSHEEQIKLVTSFDWLDLSALKGIDEELREILKGSIFIDEARCNTLCFALRKRVGILAQTIKPGNLWTPADDLYTDVVKDIAYSGEKPESSGKS